MKKILLSKIPNNTLEDMIHDGSSSYFIIDINGTVNKSIDGKCASNQEKSYANGVPFYRKLLKEQASRNNNIKEVASEPSFDLQTTVDSLDESNKSSSRLLRAFFGSQKQEQEVFWLTNDQRRINIKDMETSHIKASLAKCKRDNWRMEAVPYLENELKRRKK